MENLYDAIWVESSPSEHSTFSAAQTWVIFSNTEIGQFLHQRLEEQNQRVIIIEPGFNYQQSENNRFIVNPLIASHFDQVFNKIKDENISGVIYLWGIGTGFEEKPTLLDIQATFNLGVGGLFQTIQALSRIRLKRTPNFLIFTQGVGRLQNNMQLSSASMLGMGRVVTMEHPELACRRIDLPINANSEICATLIVKEILINDEEDSVGWEGDKRLVRRLIHYEKPPGTDKPFSIQSDKSYLLVTEMAGLGMALIKWYLQQGATHINVITQELLTESQSKEINALANDRIKINIATIDTADGNDMARVIGEFKNNSPALAGVIHAVPILENELLINQEWYRYEVAFNTKIASAWHLHQLTEEEPLNHFVLFSSVGAILSPLGCGTRVTADSFLDVLAHYRVAKRLPALSINWGPWSDESMAIKRGHEPSLKGLNRMSLKQGMDFLRELFQIPVPQIAVVDIDWKDFLKRFDRQCPMLSNFISETHTTVRTPELLTKLSASEASQQKEIIKKYLQDQVAIMSPTISKNAIAYDSAFVALGLDSLSLMELKNLIQYDLHNQYAMPMTLLFDYPNIEKLAEYLFNTISSQDKKLEGAIPIKKGQWRPNEALPLSPSQKHLLFFYRMNKNDFSNKACVTHHISGNLNAEILKNAIRDVFSRHAILRARVRFPAGTAEMIYVEDPEFEFKEYDLSKETNHEAKLGNLFEEIQQRPFDLESEPPLRVNLIKTEVNDYYFITEVSYLISGGSTLTIFFDELARNYRYYQEGGQNLIEPLAHQFFDFVTWQETFRETESYKKQLDYWVQELAEPPPTINLPSDYRRVNLDQYEVGEIKFYMGEKAIKKLKEFSVRENATIFSVLFAVYAILLYRYTRNERIHIGVPVTVRPMMEVQALIGRFINDVTIKAELQDSLSFRDLLNRLSGKLQSAFNHEEVPFETLLEKLDIERDITAYPLFQVCFDLIGSHSWDLALPGLDCRYFDVNTGSKQYDLYFEFSETSTSMMCVVKYNAKLFKKNTIEIFYDHFQNILFSALKLPDESIENFKLADDVEYHKLLLDINQTHWSYAPNKSHIRHFENRVLQYPFKIAVKCQENSLTYEKLNQRVNQLAHYLVEKNLAGAKMGVCLGRSLEMLIAVLAVSKVGGAYIPLDPKFPKDRLSYICEDAAISALVTSEKYVDLIENLKCPKIVVDREASEIATKESRNLDISTKAAHLTYIIYTSGSTGKPKGVAISQGALINHLLSMSEKPGFTSDDKLLAVTTLSFDIAGLELYLPLINGGQVVIASEEEKHDPKALAQLITENTITVMQATPTTWQMMFDSGWLGSPNLSAYCGGEVLKSELAKKLLESCKALWNMYGPTETTIWSSVKKLEDSREKISVGKPINNTQFYIFNARQRPVAIGEIGELYIGGDGLADGYYNKDDLTKEKFIYHTLDGKNVRLFRTADSVRFLSDDSIEHLGRMDNQVKIRGFRIELGDIESRILEVRGINKVLVTVREDLFLQERNLGPTLVAYLILQDGIDQESATKAIKIELDKALPDYMHPRYFVFLPEFPLTPNLKVNLKALPKPNIHVDVISADYQEPQNEDELFISKVWSEVLEVEKVGRNEQFFDIGGDSLVAMQVLDAIEKRYPGKATLVDLFQHTTVESLALYLQSASKEP